MKFNIWLNILWGLFFLVSCKHDPVEVPIGKEVPGIGFSIDSNLVYSDTIMQSGDSIHMRITLLPSDGSLLRHFKIERKTSSLLTKVADSIIDGTEFIVELNEQLALIETQELFTIYVKDSDDKSSERSIVVTTINSQSEGAPIINVIQDAGYAENGSVADVGSNVRIGITAKPRLAGQKLVAARVIRTFGTHSEVLIDSVMQEDSLRIDNIYTLSSIPGSEYWKFEVSSDNGESSFLYFFISIQRFMHTTRMGVLWNASGPFANAWDLKLNGDNDLSVPDSVQDMVNLNVGAGLFSAGWESYSNTLFKRENWYDYDNATVETAVDAYTGGTITGLPKPYTYDIEVGDYYIANIRETDEYAVVKVVSIDTTSNDDIDKIEFEYKKVN